MGLIVELVCLVGVVGLVVELCLCVVGEWVGECDF